MDAIAVVGLGCVLPGALHVSEFWNNVLAGKVALGPVPQSAWNHSLYYHPDRSVPDRTCGAVAGLVTGFTFDWRRFRVPPADVQQVNPLQWMILEAGTQALSQVRVLPRESTAIILGATGLGWQRDSGLRIRLEQMEEAVRGSEPFRSLPAERQEALLEEARQQLCRRLKEVSEDNVVGASASVACGRINMHFDLKGLHYSVDAGFASSLAALDLSVRGLVDGEFDLALTGGASELLTPLELVAFSKLGGLSSRGVVSPFDSQADGTLLGEGVAMVALKRLEDALRDGDTVYALVLGVGGSSDGRGKSLMAPRREGQALAMRRALEDARVEPGSVRYVECHATGTPVGDTSEVQALASVYGPAAAGSIALGSAKANVGHLRGAAGAVGLLKAVLALHHEQIPPQPGLQQVSPRLELESTPFFIPLKPQGFHPGPTPRAAVSAFSFGGNNFHAVLEAWRPAARKPWPRRTSREEPVAIVGMSGRFPAAPNLDSFWQRLLEGYDATREVPPERWDIGRFHDATGARREKAYTRLGCFLEELPAPDMELRIPPAAWAALDPSHVLMLRCAQAALEDAGHAPDTWDRERVALALAFLPYQGKKFLAELRLHWAEFAHELGATLERSGLPAPLREAILRSAEERFKAGLPPISEDTLTGYLGSLNAGRIAALYDFHGPHLVTDSACASGHSALHAAWKWLQHRKADVVLTGGVWCDMQPEFFVAACRFNALSAHGSFPFGARADGFVPGEGAGAFVLKRLADAERDGDRIHAVLRSVAGSSDGKGRSVLAPSEEGEALAMRRALSAAGVLPASVDYVEAHGTGTALGDVVEARATAAVYGEGRSRPLLIGSVKSNIGHLNAAAGTAGMAKAVLALRHATLPASLKSEPPNPKLPAGLQVVKAAQAWPVPEDGGPRRAGVSSFGVGGSNFHCLLEEYRPPRPATEGVPEQGEPRLVAVAGEDVRACLEQLERLGALPEPLEDTRHSPEGPWRVALTARSRAELRKKRELLRKAVEAGTELELLGSSGVFAAGPGSPLRGAPVALTFPGQGGQYPNMLRPLAQAYPVVAHTLEEADRLYQQLAGRPLTRSFFTEDPAHYQQVDEDIHAAVLLVNVALYRLLLAHGIRPAFLMGQSAGELAALVAAGSLSLEEGLRAIHSRTLAVLALRTEDPGCMVALGCGAEQVPELLAGLPGYATLAADNGPRACIVSADRRALPMLLERCAARGLEPTVLPVSHGYHSELIGPARPAYQHVLQGLRFRKPAACLISTIDSAPYGERPLHEYPAFLASQFVQPVLLRQSIEAAYQRGARIFIEAGPKWSLTQFTRETLKGRAHGAFASIHPKVGDMEQFKRVVGSAFVNGVGRLSPEEAAPTASDIEQVLLQLPLEGLLEPDTALRIAAALGQEFGVDASGALPGDLRTLEAIVALVDRLRAGEPAPAHSAAPPLPLASPSTAATSPPSPQAIEAEIRRVLMDAVVAKTGYPEDMLELDLDLEADLGIDTVKQVDIFAAVRTHFEVARDPAFVLREYNTLRKFVGYIFERVMASGGLSTAAASALAGAAATRAPASPAPPPAPSLAPAAAPLVPPPAAAARPQAAPAASTQALAEEVRTVLLRNVVEKTGYPEDMLELDLDLEADLGIDTVKQVDIFTRTREYFGVPRDQNMTLRDFNTLRKVIDHIVSRAQQLAAMAPAVPVAQAAPAVAAAAPTAAAAPAAPAPVATASPSPPGAPRSVREALLAMDLSRLGVSPAEVRRLGEALSSRLALPAAELGGVKTLGELVQRLGKG